MPNAVGAFHDTAIWPSPGVPATPVGTAAEEAFATVITGSAGSGNCGNDSDVPSAERMSAPAGSEIGPATSMPSASVSPAAIV